MQVTSTIQILSELVFDWSEGAGPRIVPVLGELDAAMAWGRCPPALRLRRVSLPEVLSVTRQTTGCVCLPRLLVVKGVFLAPFLIGVTSGHADGNVDAALLLNAEQEEQEKESPEPASLGQRLRFFRWLEDYSDVTAEQRETSHAAKLKRIPLDRGEQYPFLTLGGDYRFRYENYSNQFFGLGDEERSESVQHRFMLLGEFRWAESARTFVQLSAFEESGRPGGPRPFDESRVDIQQAFIDVKLGSTVVRGGRQELLFAGDKLVTVREGPNQRRSFDALRITAVGPRGMQIDGVIGREVQPRTSSLDDTSGGGPRLWGVYATNVARGAAGGIDVLYFGLDRDDSVFEIGVGNEQRHTLGVRLSHDEDRWDFEYQGYFQFGRFESNDIRAWSIVTENYYSFVGSSWRPRLGLRANVASGDRDPGDGVLGTFDALFPNFAYLTEAALYAPRNIYELQLLVDLWPAEGVRVRLRSNFLWRFSTSDALYAPPGFPLVPADASDARFNGYVLDAILTWTPTPYLTLESALVHAAAGDVIRDGGGEDTDYFLLSLGTRF